MFFFVFPSDLRRLLIGWPAFSVCRVSFSGYLSIGGATATGGRLMSLTITDKKKKSVIAYQVGTEHNECNSFNKKKNIPKSTTQVALGTWRRQRKIIKSNIFIFFLDQQIQEKKKTQSLRFQAAPDSTDEAPQFVTKKMISFY